MSTGQRRTGRHPLQGAWQTLSMAGCLLLLGAPMQAQSSLPATAPTGVTASQLPSANPGVAAPTTTEGTLKLNWDGHLLQVNANNVALASVLRGIAARTGTHLAGSLPTDRIFGDYGPAPLGDVLATLLDDPSINVLFVDRVASKPPELTLTSRVGGPSPPMPQAPQSAQAEPVSPPPSRSFGGAPGIAMGAPDAPPNGAPPSQPGQAGAAASTGADGGATSGTDATQASPNGVKTPQEIFEQLQRLRAAAAASNQSQ